jgi:hypothetical protein
MRTDPEALGGGDDTTEQVACVARLPLEHGNRVGAVLAPRVRGYLAVRVHFDGYPVAGLAVRFFETDGQRRRGASLGEAVVTDEEGVARLERVVRFGSYLCEVADQRPTVVAAVARFDQPYPLVLPIGRPFVQLEAVHEFELDDGGAHEPAALQPAPGEGAEADAGSR